MVSCRSQTLNRATTNPRLTTAMLVLIHARKVLSLARNSVACRSRGTGAPLFSICPLFYVILGKEPQCRWQDKTDHVPTPTFSPRSRAPDRLKSPTGVVSAIVDGRDHCFHLWYCIPNGWRRQQGIVACHAPPHLRNPDHVFIHESLATT